MELSAQAFLPESYVCGAGLKLTYRMVGHCAMDRTAALTFAEDLLLVLVVTMLQGQQAALRW